MTEIVCRKTLDGVVEVEEHSALGIVADHALEPEETADASFAGDGAYGV